jgi:hypothetical protein
VCIVGNEESNFFRRRSPKEENEKEKDRKVIENQ